MPDTPESLDTRLLRRRLPLELTVEELSVLERHQAMHGSKRATLVAGLRALDAQPDPDQVAQAERARDEAITETTRLRSRVTELEAAAKNSATTASRRDAASAESTAAAKADATALKKQLTTATRDLAHAQADAAEWEEAYAELDAQRVDGLRCPRCEQWATPDEWATTKTDDGYLLIYHKPCGYHEKSFTSVPTIMGYRRDD